MYATSSFKEDYESGRIKFDGKMYNIDEFIQQKIQRRGYFTDIDYRFQYQYEGSGSYGCDQGGISNLIDFKNKLIGYRVKYSGYKSSMLQGMNAKDVERVAKQEYMDIKDYISNKYNLSKRDTANIIKAMDTVGACSYASEVNDLVSFFSTRQDEFEKTFGYPLYKENELGVGELNDKKILADLYVFANHSNNGGKLIYVDKKGNAKVDYKYMSVDQNGYAELGDRGSQEYMMRWTQINDKLINKYLKSKGSQYTYVYRNLNKNKAKHKKGVVIGKSYTEKQMQKIKDNAYFCMQNGEELQCSIVATENAEIRLIDMETNQTYISTKNWGEGSGHAVKITGMAQDGFIVSSWGKRLLIPYSDLQKSGAFTIFSGTYQK